MYLGNIFTARPPITPPFPPHNLNRDKPHSKIPSALALFVITDTKKKKKRTVYIIAYWSRRRAKEQKRQRLFQGGGERRKSQEEEVTCGSRPSSGTISLKRVLINICFFSFMGGEAVEK